MLQTDNESPLRSLLNLTSILLIFVCIFLRYLFDTPSIPLRYLFARLYRTIYIMNTAQSRCYMVRGIGPVCLLLIVNSRLRVKFQTAY